MFERQPMELARARALARPRQNNALDVTSLSFPPLPLLTRPSPSHTLDLNLTSGCVDVFSLGDPPEAKPEKCVHLDPPATGAPWGGGLYPRRCFFFKPSLAALRATLLLDWRVSVPTGTPEEKTNSRFASLSTSPASTTTQG